MDRLLFVDMVLYEEPRQSKDHQDDHGTDPEGRSNEYLHGDGVESFGPCAEKRAEGNLAETHAEDDPGNDAEFKSARECVADEARMVSSASFCMNRSTGRSNGIGGAGLCSHGSPDRIGEDANDQKERMPDGRDAAWLDLHF